MAHEWDTEPVKMVTYTPPEEYDRPWVIRMCCGCETPGCKALLIDMDRANGSGVYVPEEAA